MPQQFIDDSALLEQTITSLSIKVHTADATNADTDNKIYCNVVFKDGSLLSNHENLRIDTSGHNDFERGITDSYDLLISDGLEKTIGDIDELYIRKSGSDGWLLGSAPLFANDIDLPVIGNSEINQFLDNSKAVLFIRDWSTKSLCGSSGIPAEYPLLCPNYQISGPILGQFSDTSANVLFRVEREGEYRLRVREATSGQVVFDRVQTLSPTTRYQVNRLTPNTHYKFDFFHVYRDQDLPVPDGGGEFRTFPAEGSGVKVGFAFGSCSRNTKNVAQNAWTGIKNLGADPTTDPVETPSFDVRFFIHLGDTFYFYDDVQKGREPKNLRTVLAANLSARKHPRFLEMARRIPSCGVWDDHDFRKNDADSVGFGARADAVKGFLDYWGNDPLPLEGAGPDIDLTTRLSYGNVDVYLLDGLFRRDKDAGVCFSQARIDQIEAMITERGRTSDRLVILASGGTWNHTRTGGQDYGNSSFDDERESLYGELKNLIGDQIKGLVFLSGNVHRNEIYEVELGSVAGTPRRVAPEFVSSPLGNNSNLKADKIKGERKWSVPSRGDQPRRGFTTLEIDTTSREPDGAWKLTVSYYSADASVATPYHVKEYTLSNGQFVF